MSIKVLRAHHVIELYFEYVQNGSMPEKDIFENPINFPIQVTNNLDDICRQCRMPPALNFCNGPQMRQKDYDAAQILGLKIGERYTAEQLAAIFSNKAEEHCLQIGTKYDRPTLLGRCKIKR